MPSNPFRLPSRPVSLEGLDAMLMGGGSLKNVSLKTTAKQMVRRTPAWRDSCRVWYAAVLVIGPTLPLTIPVNNNRLRNVFSDQNRSDPLKSCLLLFASLLSVARCSKLILLSFFIIIHTARSGCQTCAYFGFVCFVFVLPSCTAFEPVTLPVCNIIFQKFYM